MTSRAETPADYTGLLAQLVERGFAFVHPTDADGEVAEIVGVRAHDNVVDVVKLRGEHDVLAVRLPGTETDVQSPKQVLWRSFGHVSRVLGDLLALPDDGEYEAPCAAGAWLSNGAGRAKWVMAEAS